MIEYPGPPEPPPSAEKLTAEIRRQAVADFVNEQSARYRKHSADAVIEDTVLAIRRFGCQPEDFYDDEHGQNWIRAQVALVEAEE